MKNTPTLLIASLLLSFIPDACYSSHYNTFDAYIMNIDSSLKKEIKATFSNNDSQLTAETNLTIYSFVKTLLKEREAKESIR